MKGKLLVVWLVAFCLVINILITIGFGFLNYYVFQEPLELIVQTSFLQLIISYFVTLVFSKIIWKEELLEVEEEKE